MTQLSTKLPWELAQTKWPAAINPVLALPIIQGNQIDNIILVANRPLVVNHLLGKVMQGWLLVDNNANAFVRRTATFNNLTITLESSADATISIWVY